jgi:hypothetical protein
MADALGNSDALIAFNAAAEDREEVMRRFEPTILTTDPRGPHYLEDINDIKDEMVGGFIEQAVGYKIPLDDPEGLGPYEYASLRDIAGLEAVNMRTLLPFSEPHAPVFVRISEAPFINTSMLAGDELIIGRIDQGMSLQGQYAGLAPIPAPTLEAFMANLEGDFATHLTLGIVLEGVVTIDADGSIAEADIDEGQVIVALNMPYSDLRRVRYKCDELFITPPDDTTQH